MKKGIFCDDASVLEEPRVAQDGVLSAVVLPTPDQQGYIIYVTTTDKMRYTYSSLTRQTIVENTETLYNAQNSDTKTKIYIKQCALALAMTYVDYLKPYSDYPAGMSCDNPTIQDGPTNKSGVLTSGIYPDPNNPDNVQVKATSDLGHTFLYDLQSNTFVQL